MARKGESVCLYAIKLQAIRQKKINNKKAWHFTMPGYIYCRKSLQRYYFNSARYLIVRTI